MRSSFLPSLKCSKNSQALIFHCKIGPFGNLPIKCGRHAEILKEKKTLFSTEAQPHCLILSYRKHFLELMEQAKILMNWIWRKNGECMDLVVGIAISATKCLYFRAFNKKWSGLFYKRQFWKKKNAETSLTGDVAANFVYYPSIYRGLVNSCAVELVETFLRIDEKSASSKSHLSFLPFLIVCFGFYRWIRRKGHIEPIWTISLIDFEWFHANQTNASKCYEFLRIECIEWRAHVFDFSNHRFNLKSRTNLIRSSRHFSSLIIDKIRL